MSWRRQRARPNVPLLFSRARVHLNRFITSHCHICARVRGDRRGVCGGICQAGGAIPGTVRFAQIGACVKRGHKIRQMTRQRGGQNDCAVAGCRSGGDSGGVWPDRPGPPGASCPGDAFDEAAIERTDAGAGGLRRGMEGGWKGSRVWTECAPGQRA